MSFLQNDLDLLECTTDQNVVSKILLHLEQLSSGGMLDSQVWKTTISVLRVNGFGADMQIQLLQFLSRAVRNVSVISVEVVDDLVDTLWDVCNKYRQVQNEEIALECCEALYQLKATHSKVLAPIIQNHIRRITEVCMERVPTNLEIQKIGCRIAAESTLSYRGDQGLVRLVIEALGNFPSSIDVLQSVRSICFELVSEPKFVSEPKWKGFLVQYGLPEFLLLTLGNFNDRPDILADVLQTMLALAWGNFECVNALRQNVDSITCISQVMEQYPLDHEGIQGFGCGLVGVLCADQTVEYEIRLVLDALRRNPSSLLVQSAGCGALANMVLNSNTCLEDLMDPIFQAMKKFSKEVSLQAICCGTLANIARRPISRYDTERICKRLEVAMKEFPESNELHRNVCVCVKNLYFAENVSEVVLNMLGEGMCNLKDDPQTQTALCSALSAVLSNRESASFSPKHFYTLETNLNNNRQTSQLQVEGLAALGELWGKLPIENRPSASRLAQALVDCMKFFPEDREIFTAAVMITAKWLCDIENCLNLPEFYHLIVKMMSRADADLPFLISATKILVLLGNYSECVVGQLVVEKLHISLLKLMNLFPQAGALQINCSLSLLFLFRHSSARADFHAAGGLKQLLLLLKEHQNQENAGLFKALLYCLQMLIESTETNKGRDVKKALDVKQAILMAFKLKDPEVHSAALGTLAKLSFYEANQSQRIMNEELVDQLIRSVQVYPLDVAIRASACTLLSSLDPCLWFGDATFQQRLPQVFSIVVECLTEFPNEWEPQLAACKVLHTLSTDSSARNALGELGLVPKLHSTLELEVTQPRLELKIAIFQSFNILASVTKSRVQMLNSSLLHDLLIHVRANNEEGQLQFFWCQLITNLAKDLPTWKDKNFILSIVHSVSKIISRKAEEAPYLQVSAMAALQVLHSLDLPYKLGVPPISRAVSTLRLTMDESLLEQTCRFLSTVARDRTTHPALLYLQAPFRLKQVIEKRAQLNDTTLVEAIKSLTTLCISTRSRRQLARLDVPQTVFDLANSNLESVDCARAVCALVLGLSLDKGMRERFVRFGVHLHMIRYMQKFSEDPEVQRKALGSILLLTTSESTIGPMKASGILQCIIVAMERHLSHKELQVTAFRALIALCQTSDDIAALQELRVNKVVVRVMNETTVDIDSQILACSLILRLASLKEATTAMVKDGVPLQLVRTLQRHVRVARIQRLAMLGLLKFLISEPESALLLVQERLPSAIVKAMQEHQEHLAVHKLGVILTLELLGLLEDSNSLVSAGLQSQLIRTSSSFKSVQGLTKLCNVCLLELTQNLKPESTAISFYSRVLQLLADHKLVVLLPSSVDILWLQKAFSYKANSWRTPLVILLLVQLSVHCSRPLFLSALTLSLCSPWIQLQ